MKIKRKKRGKSKRSRQKAGTFFFLLSSSCSQYMVEVCVCCSHIQFKTNKSKIHFSRQSNSKMKCY